MTNRNKTSIAWTIDHAKLQSIINESNSMVMILKKIGLNAYNGSGRTLYRRIFETNEFDLSVFNSNKKKRMADQTRQRLRLPTEYYLEKTTNDTRHILKRRIIEEELVEYVCRDCQNKGFHNDKPLSLQLEHIDGDGCNNKLNNLCFLCPNCHSQTPTYAGKKTKMGKVYESPEAKEERLEAARKFWVTKEKLKLLVAIYPMTTIGEMFGVSDNAIRKRCKLLGIEFKKKAKI